MKKTLALILTIAMRVVQLLVLLELGTGEKQRDAPILTVTSVKIGAF